MKKPEISSKRTHIHTYTHTGERDRGAVGERELKERKREALNHLASEGWNDSIDIRPSRLPNKTLDSKEYF